MIHYWLYLGLKLYRLTLSNKGAIQLIKVFQNQINFSDKVPISDKPKMDGGHGGMQQQQQHHQQQQQQQHEAMQHHQL